MIVGTRSAIITSTVIDIRQSAFGKRIGKRIDKPRMT